MVKCLVKQQRHALEKREEENNRGLQKLQGLSELLVVDRLWGKSFFTVEGNLVALLKSVRI